MCKGELIVIVGVFVSFGTYFSLVTADGHWARYALERCCHSHKHRRVALQPDTCWCHEISWTFIMHVPGSQSTPAHSIDTYPELHFPSLSSHCETPALQALHGAASQIASATLAPQPSKRAGSPIANWRLRCRRFSAALSSVTRATSTTL